MQIAEAGIFKIEFELKAQMEASGDVQFGMDFTLTQTGPSCLPLMQLIFPATPVGTNQPGVWNLDNHEQPSYFPACLIFPDAMRGEIYDTPRESSDGHTGLLRTKFAVFRVDLTGAVVESTGVAFSYFTDTRVDGSETIIPLTWFEGFSTAAITDEQKAVVRKQCSIINFS